jgi:cytochrome c551/c552
MEKKIKLKWLIGGLALVMVGLGISLFLIWRQRDLPVEQDSKKAVDLSASKEAEEKHEKPASEGAFFVEKGCFTCHEVSSLGIKSLTKAGPDLANAYVDVQSRFGKTLEEFFTSPTGTMAIILSEQIKLTEAEKQEVIEKLKLAYQRKLKEENQAEVHDDGKD